LEKLIKANNNRIQKSWAEQEITIVGNLRKKIISNKLILIQADKGKTAAILHQQGCNQKVVHFMECNHISEITKDPTEKYQTKIREQINKSDIILHKTEKWKFANLNPEAPSLKALIKLHKENKPIRLIISSCNSPAYKISKYITQTLQQVLNLPNTYNVKNIKNSIKLTQEIDNLNIDHNTRFCSFDITNMYTIPGFDTRHRQRVVLPVSASRPAMGSTQPPVQWVPGVLSPGVKSSRGVILTTHSHLVPRLRMSRSCTSSHPMRLHGV
jgi:hypothetical protein